MDTHSHELLDAQLGGMDCGELSLAAQLQGEDHSLTLFDRAYFSAAFLLDWQGAGEQRHWLMHAKVNLRHELIEPLAPGDADRGGWSAPALHHLAGGSPRGSSPRTG